jgi:hypothetical protein
LPFLISWTLTLFLIAEFGCLASTPTFCSAIPFAWEAHPKGLAFRAGLLVPLVTTELPGSMKTLAHHVSAKGLSKRALVFFSDFRIILLVFQILILEI